MPHRRVHASFRFHLWSHSLPQTSPPSHPPPHPTPSTSSHRRRQHHDRHHHQGGADAAVQVDVHHPADGDCVRHGVQGAPHPRLLPPVRRPGERRRGGAGAGLHGRMAGGMARLRDDAAGSPGWGAFTTRPAPSTRPPPPSPCVSDPYSTLPSLIPSAHTHSPPPRPLVCRRPLAWVWTAR